MIRSLDSSFLDGGGGGSNGEGGGCGSDEAASSDAAELIRDNFPESSSEVGDNLHFLVHVIVTFNNSLIIESNHLLSLGGLTPLIVA